MLFAKRAPILKRLLIVEDEALVAFDNEHFLGDNGFDVVATVDNVAAAVSIIATTQLDLVLADISLSDNGNGLDVARAAQERGVPVLFVTGSCPAEARALAIGCLAKPYSQRDLRSAIEAVGETLTGVKVRRAPPGLSIFAA
jgi:DNA-binding response OmpR family regulator